jgi:hypothetical protein
MNMMTLLYGDSLEAFHGNRERLCSVAASSYKALSSFPQLRQALEVADYELAIDLMRGRPSYERFFLDPSRLTNNMKLIEEGHFHAGY